MDVWFPEEPPCMYMSGLMTACYSKFSGLIHRTETVSRWIVGLWLWGPVVSFFDLPEPALADLAQTTGWDSQIMT